MHAAHNCMQVTILQWCNGVRDVPQWVVSYDPAGTTKCESAKTTACHHQGWQPLLSLRGPPAPPSTAPCKSEAVVLALDWRVSGTFGSGGCSGGAHLAFGTQGGGVGVVDLQPRGVKPQVAWCRTLDNEVPSALLHRLLCLCARMLAVAMGAEARLGVQVVFALLRCLLAWRARGRRTARCW